MWPRFYDLCIASTSCNGHPRLGTFFVGTFKMFPRRMFPSVDVRATGNDKIRIIHKEKKTDNECRGICRKYVYPRLSNLLDSRLSNLL